MPRLATKRRRSARQRHARPFKRRKHGHEGYRKEYSVEDAIRMVVRSGLRPDEALRATCRPCSLKALEEALDGLKHRVAAQKHDSQISKNEAAEAPPAWISIKRPDSAASSITAGCNCDCGADFLATVPERSCAVAASADAPPSSASPASSFPSDASANSSSVSMISSLSVSSSATTTVHSQLREERCYYLGWGTYHGQFDWGEPHGWGKMTWDDHGSFYRGEWKCGEMDGWGRIQFADGSFHASRFRDGAPVGEGVLWNSEDLTYWRLEGNDRKEEISYFGAKDIMARISAPVPEQSERARRSSKNTEPTTKCNKRS